MPFKSDKQRKWMHANEPEMAKKWEKEEALREKIRGIIKRELEATTTSVIPPHDTPTAFKKSTYKAIQVDDEDDSDELLGGIKDYRKKITKLDKNEARTINVEPNWEGMWRFFKQMAKTNPRDWKRMERTLGSDWKKIDAMAKKNKWTESINESDLGLTYKKGKTVKVTHKKSGKELVIIDKPNVKREYEKIGYFTEGRVNESPMAPFSSSEAKQHINQDIKKMSKHLGKASQQSIKIMMDGVKGGKYTAMDISRGIKEGPAGRAHFGELGFLQQLWNKVRDGFRRYTKDRKLS